MKFPLFRFALVTAALQAALPFDAHAGGDGSTATLFDQPSATSPGATPETVAAYTFITSRTLHANSNMIEGQHLGGPNDLNPPAGTADVFDMQTYRIASTATPGLNAYPRLIGARYDNNALTAHSTATLDSTTIGQINLKLEGIANTYHPLVAITATPLNPWDTTRHLDRQPLPDGGDGLLSDLAYANWHPSTGLDTPANRFWADIAKIADGLAGLKDANGKPIPVLFRPFAEINTNKYYFKGQNAHDFVALWNDVVTYYRDIRGLHNLIYCWEAWTWGSSSSASPQQTYLDHWFPANQVDVVGGAFYFTATNRDDGYFNLQFGTPGAPTPQNIDDQAIFNDLMSLAVNNNKPFGATQWAVDQNYAPGDNQNTLAFMTALDNLRRTLPASAQHMAFDYNWTTTQEANWQANADKLVDDPRVATVSSVDGVVAKQGLITESAAGSGVGGSLNSSVLQTGFSGTNQQYRTILSFATGILPPNATVESTIGLSLLVSPQNASPASNPYDVRGQAQWVDAGWVNGVPGVFGSSAMLEMGDFNAAGQPHVADLSDWRANPTTGRAPATFSAASIPSKYLSVKGPTQLRTYFTVRQPGAQIVWNGNPVAGTNMGDDWAPQLVFTYTLP